MRSARVCDIMTESPVCCEPRTPLYEAARLMAEHDCGELPVVEDAQSMRPIGVITDRDIACRGVAQRIDTNAATVEQCMSSPPVCVTKETDLRRVVELLEKNQIRRIPVVDEGGRVCGIVSQADVARYLEDREAADVLRAVSRKSSRPSSVSYESRTLDGGR